MMTGAVRRSFSMAGPSVRTFCSTACLHRISPAGGSPRGGELGCVHRELTSAVELRRTQPEFSAEQTPTPSASSSSFGLLSSPGGHARSPAPTRPYHDSTNPRPPRGKKPWKAVDTAEERPRRKTEQSATRDDKSGKTAEKAEKRRWEPKKKLTHATMSAIKELHRQDPQQWTKAALSRQFGVSYEAIARILKSNWREKEAARAAPASSQTITAPGKWSLGEEEGMTIAERADPAAFVRKAYELKRAVEAERREKGE